MPAERYSSGRDSNSCYYVFNYIFQLCNLIRYDTIRYEMLPVDRLMSRPRSITDDDSSLIPRSQFQCSSYTHLWLSSTAANQSISTHDLSLWHPPRVSKSKRPRLQKRRSTNVPARFARKLAVNVFTSLSLGPESSTWRLTLLNWRHSAKINVTVQYSYEGILDHPAAAKSGLMFCLFL